TLEMGEFNPRAGGSFPPMALAFSTARFPCNSVGPGRPAYRLPIEVAARPQYAMAHLGSSWEMAVKVLAAAGNEKVCSIATARSNFPWTPALQATGKCTSPNCSWRFSRSFLASPFFSWASAETGNRISTGTDSTNNIALRMTELLANTTDCSGSWRLPPLHINEYTRTLCAER